MSEYGELGVVAIKGLLRTNRQFFFEFILSHYIKTNDVNELHREWFSLLSSERKLGIIAPRGHAKSSIINIADNLFDICNGYEPYIVIFSDTPEQATEHLGAMVEELEGNERLIEFYGQLYEPRMVGDRTKEKWTQSTIITKNGVKVEAKGWRSKTRGMRWKEYRPSKIVIDDIENDEDVMSQKMRNKLKATFEKKILNLGEPEAKYRFVGTILHFDSLLQNEFKKPRDGWTWRMYKAYKPDNEPLWPEWWTRERLENRRREIGEIPFNQEFMNNPLDPSTQIFKPVEFYDSIDLTMVECFGYIDLAISEKETADYTAIVTIGRHKNSGKLYVIEPVRIRGSISEQLQLVFDMNKKYHYKTFGVESVAYQKAFAQVLTQKSNEMNEYIPVSEIQIDKDKVRRAIEITPYVENGTIVFNASHQEFMAELVQFPKAEKDDMCLIGNTGIITDKGTKKIKDVKAGDVVLSKGFNKVLKVYDNGIKDTIKLNLSNGKSLIGTQNHPVYVPEMSEYLPMDSIVGMMILWKKIQKQSQLTELSLGDIRTQLGETIVFISKFTASGNKHQFTYIDIFMKNMWALFLMMVIYTIKTAIHLTTRLKTWSASLKQTICDFITQGSVVMLNANTSNQSETAQKCGIEARQEESGIENMQLQDYRLKNAVLVEKSLSKQLGSKSIARSSVSQTMNNYTGLRRFADSVLRSLWHSVIEYNFALVNVLSREEGKPQRVYNLEIENSHTYLANGVLVHNCDAFVGACKLALNSSVSSYTIKTAGTSIYKGNE